MFLKPPGILGVDVFQGMFGDTPTSPENTESHHVQPWLDRTKLHTVNTVVGVALLRGALGNREAQISPEAHLTETVHRRRRWRRR